MNAIPATPPPVWLSQAYDAVLFDCDGTLADTMPAHYRAWRHLADLHGLVLDEERFYSLGGRPTRDIVATLAAEVGVAIDLEHAVHVKESAFLAQLEHVEAIDPVVDVARRVAGRVPTAVVTGGHRDVCLQILGHVGLTGLFDTIVASEDTSRHKPDPEPFLEAARRLSARPARCVVWEDSDLGIRAAAAAGMSWVDVRSFHAPKRVDA